MCLGLVSGVTTNSSLATKEKSGDLESYQSAVLAVVEIINATIFVEVIA